MKNLYVVKDGIENMGCKVDKNRNQIKGTNFYLLTYGKGNEGYIEKKTSINWLLYTQIGEIKTIIKMNQEGILDKSNARYHYFSSFEKCIEQLRELCENSFIIICDSDNYPKLVDEHQK